MGGNGFTFLGKDAEPARKQLTIALNDESDHVRMISAWALLKIGDADKCYKTIGEIIAKEGPSLIFALNVVDWMGEEGKPWHSKHLLVKTQVTFRD